VKNYVNDRIDNIQTFAEHKTQYEAFQKMSPTVKKLVVGKGQQHAMIGAEILQTFVTTEKGEAMKYPQIINLINNADTKKDQFPFSDAAMVNIENSRARLLDPGLMDPDISTEGLEVFNEMYQPLYVASNGDSRVIDSLLKHVQENYAISKLGDVGLEGVTDKQLSTNDKTSINTMITDKGLDPTKTKVIIDPVAGKGKLVDISLGFPIISKTFNYSKEEARQERTETFLQEQDKQNTVDTMELMP
jgi:hypothetical protein